MAISVTVPAQSYDLTTLDRVKDRLKILHTSKDLQLARMITSTSKSLVRKLCREFARETISETVKGYGTNKLLLTRTPIISVTSILLEADPVIDFTIDDPDAGILYRRNGWDWTGVSGFMGIGFNPVPGSEESLFTVVYEAGYILPSYDTTPPDRDLPEDVEDLVLDYIQFLYGNRNQKDLSINSYRIGDISVNKGSGSNVSTFLSDFNRRCLDYKRIV